LADSVLAEYRSEHIIQRLTIILTELNEFFDHKQQYQGNIPELSYWYITKLRSQRILAKLKKKFKL
jgi:hypothetical protein